MGHYMSRVARLDERATAEIAKVLLCNCVGLGDAQ